MIPFHSHSVDDVFRALQTDSQGLTNEQVEARREHHGKNVLPARKRLTVAQIFLHQFFSPLIYILLVAAVVSLFLQEYVDAGFIFLVLLFNAFIGTVQEWKAESKASALEQMIRIRVRVLRNGEIHLMDSEELVPGDMVLLESGSKVPADIRLVQETNLKVTEAVLTGESLPVEKQVDPTHEEDVPLADRSNMLFAATTVVSGRAKGVVTATGKATEVGRIAASLKELTVGKTPLLQRMERFTKRISIIILTACALLGVIGYFMGVPWNELFMLVVAIAVSSIPEGLPIAMTVALAIGASRMARRQVIIRKLSAVEGLGSCTFIATDKTGTLTVDRQTVREVVLSGGRVFQVSGEGYDGSGQVKTDDSTVVFGDDPGFDRLVRAVVWCNEGSLIQSGEDWEYAGDPIDVALLALAYKSGTTPKTLFEEVEVVREVPFESERQYAAVYTRNRRSGKLCISVKGAVEKIRAKLDVSANTALLDIIDHYAEDGYRIIAVADAEVSQALPIEELPPLELIGFVALIDPLRPEAKQAVLDCHAAGVEVAMITGDHPSTAFAIAKNVGIASDRSQLISGKELDALKEDPDAWSQAVRNRRVFSRVSPQQKQEVVEHLRETGHFIAVTGDGVNDAPALRTANIGVAMGYGTDVAKDTASIIVSDNNFASIEAGIEEGRFTYSNIRKIIYLLISTGAAELITIGLSLAVGVPIPFLPVQLLWLNLVTNGIQDVALAFEAGEKEVMRRPPRKPHESIFDKLMVSQTIVAATVISLLVFGLWYWLIEQLNWDEYAARNVILMLMVLLQNFHAFNSRSETRSIFKIPISNNYMLVFGVLLAQALHILVLHVPIMQELLSVQPIGLEEWGRLLLTATVLVVVMELFKFIVHRFKLFGTV